MSMWRSSQSWQPPQFGWSHPAEWPPFIAWLAPAALGVLVMVAGRASDGAFPGHAGRLEQLGVFGDYWASTLLYSPLWGFPAILAAFPLRALLISSGLFGWASALLAGALAGLAVPVLLGAGLWLDGLLYGASYLGVQYLIYRALYGAEFSTSSD